MTTVRYHFLTSRKNTIKREVVKIAESSYDRYHYFNQYKNGKEVVIFDEEDDTTKIFLDNVYNLLDSTTNHTNLNLLIPNKITTFYQSANEIISNHIQQQINKFLAKQPNKKIETWINCLEGCKEQLESYIQTESISTAYYIRLFANSIIHINMANDIPLKLRIYYNSDDTSLSGKIEYDHRKFYIAWDKLQEKTLQTGGSNNDFNSNTQPLLPKGRSNSIGSLESISLENPVVKTIIRCRRCR